MITQSVRYWSEKCLKCCIFIALQQNGGIDVPNKWTFVYILYFHESKYAVVQVIEKLKGNWNVKLEYYQNANDEADTYLVFCVGGSFFFFFPSMLFISSVLEGEKRGKEGFFEGGAGCRSLPLSGGILNWPRQTAATTPDEVTMKRGHQGHDLSSPPDKRPVWTNLGLGLAPDTGPRSVWDARSPAASARLLKAEGF